MAKRWIRVYGVIHVTPIIFEWLHWFAYPIIGLAAGQYVLWIYPLLMWLFYITSRVFHLVKNKQLKVAVKIILIINKNINVYSAKTKKIGAHMDFIVHQSLKIVESGVIPDHAIRAAIRALSKSA